MLSSPKLSPYPGLSFRRILRRDFNVEGYIGEKKRFLTNVCTNHKISDSVICV